VTGRARIRKVSRNLFCGLFVREPCETRRLSLAGDYDICSVGSHGVLYASNEV
jgi:hypothetical protein